MEEQSFNIKKILQNPSGKYSSYFARRDLIIESLKNRYSKLIQQKKKFHVDIYKDKDDIYYHVKVPSEEVNDLHYDVVLQAVPTLESYKTDLTIKNYDIKLFSNSPAFMFTYAYVCYHTDNFVNFLKDKLNDLAFTKPPEIRNPVQAYGFEKSIYFALLYIKDLNLETKININTMASKLNEKNLYKDISTADALLKKRKLLKQKEKEKDKNNKFKKETIKRKSITKSSKKPKTFSTRNRRK